jgi:hypothetical protein
MTTERDPGTRIVLSWLREDAHENHAIYDRITVAGPETVGVRLTQAATATASRWRCPKKGCSGAPDRCWARVSNLRHPDRRAG